MKPKCKEMVPDGRLRKDATDPRRVYRPYRRCKRNALPGSEYCRQHGKDEYCDVCEAITPKALIEGTCVECGRTFGVAAYHFVRLADQCA